MNQKWVLFFFIVVVRSLVPSKNTLLDPYTLQAIDCGGQYILTYSVEPYI